MGLGIFSGITGSGDGGSGGGGGTPGSPASSVQFNNAGAFGGSANLSWDNTNIALNAGPATGFTTNESQYYISISSQILSNLNNLTASMISNGESSAAALVNQQSDAAGSLSTLEALNAVAEYTNLTGASSSVYGAVLSAYMNSPSGGAIANHLFGLSTFAQQTAGATTQMGGIRVGSNVKSAGTVPNNYGIKIEDQTAGTTNWALNTGLGKVQFGDAVTISANVTLPFSMAKNTQSATAPGAGFACLRFEVGTGANTAKLVAYAGTSATGVTIADNIGGGF